MTQPSTHITFSCAHAALVPAHLYEQNAANDIDCDFSKYFLDNKTSLADTEKDATTTFTFHYGPCGRDTCYTISTKTLQHQILERIAAFRSSLTESQESYTELGTRYHSTPLALRASFANDPACAMAHLQFGITTQTWEQDVFFEPWMEVAAYCSDIQRRLLSPWFDTGSKNVTKVGKLFVLCARGVVEVATLLGMLKLGLTTLEKGKREQDSRIVVHDLPTDPEERETIQRCLKDARVAKEKNLSILNSSTEEAVVVKCNSPSQAQRARKLLKPFQAYGQSLLASKERRFAVKDETKMLKLAFKNVIKSIWGERMSGFVNLTKGSGRAWWVLS